MEIDIHKLLNREPVSVSLGQALSYIKGKRILITGAGGSIGSELSRQLIFGGASRLYLFGHGENSIYETYENLKSLTNEERRIIPIIGELQDKDYIHFLMKRLKADVVFHTAAHKHIPLTEINPVGAIKNNVFGTKNIVDASKESGVSKFIFISTDKSVDPICIYGVSKLIAEEIVLEAGKNNHKFLVVRFGNVLGSKGSIVPHFINQIENGGPVTITDKEVTRYFMTISEAVSLILKVGGMGQSSELYLLKMGEPVKILDLAKKIMKLMNIQVPLEFIGLRRGDKLHEELWSTEKEKLSSTRYRGIVKVECLTKINNLDIVIEKLKYICFHYIGEEYYFRNRKIMRKILKEAFPTLRTLDYEPEY